MTNVSPLDSDGSRTRRRARAPVFFDRRELNAILNIYGRMVIAGQWRDYSFASAPDHAAFCAHRHASEQPAYRIVKEPALARRQGAYTVVNAAGHVLKRGHDLRQVLRLFDAKLIRLAEI